MLLTIDKVFSDRLMFRNLHKKDTFGPYLDWFKDPLITNYLSVNPENITQESLQEYILKNNNSLSQLLLGIFIPPEQHIGNIRLLDIDLNYSRASIGILIGDRGCWGTGYATESIKEMTAIGHQGIGLKRLFAGCDESNLGSIYAFKKANYKRLEELDPSLANQDNWLDGLSKEHVMLVHLV